MPLKVSYRDDGGVVITASGKVTGQELLENGETIYATEALVKKLSYMLVDLTGASQLEVSADEIRRIVQQDIAAAKLNPNMLAAVVSADNLAYGLSRMWAAYSARISRMEPTIADPMKRF